MLLNARSDAVREPPSMPGWFPWRRRQADSVARTKVEPTGPVGMPSGPQAGSADVRQRLAASSSRQLDQPLSRAMGSIFRVIQQLDTLVDRHTTGPHAMASGSLDAQEGLTFVDTAGAELDVTPTDLAATLRQTQDMLNDALLDCDRLGVMVEGLQRLIEAHPFPPAPTDLGTVLSQAAYRVRALCPQGPVLVERRGPAPAVMAESAEIGQALTDALEQMARCTEGEGPLMLSTSAEGAEVHVDVRAPQAAARAAARLQLETVAEVVTRHQGQLRFLATTPGGLHLRLSLPACP
ncbi:hypothetical protein ACLIJR_17380 [Hydrogenophaga sp. XSHU_21]